MNIKLTILASYIYVWYVCYSHHIYSEKIRTHDVKLPFFK
jgi:uncharacterized membrane protein